MTAVDVAQARQDRLIAVTDVATVRSLRAWASMSFEDLNQSWLAVGPVVTEQVVQAQLTAARGSDRYTGAMSTQYGFSQDSSALVPGAFAGVDGAGGAVDGLLLGAVTTTKQAIAGGLGPRSLEAGAAYLATMIKTAVHDVARQADMVSATGRGYTHYVRVVNPGACSRCAILAGVSSYKTAFRRHPACRCSTAPIEGDGSSPEGFFDSPDEYFDSLSEPEQDRIFTKAGAQAHRDGASLQSVVSARRGGTGITTSRGVGRQTVANSGRRLEKTTIGYSADGSPIQVYTTSEGTTRRGDFGYRQRLLGVQDQRLSGARYSSTKRIRLMPEEIYNVAGTPAEARVLLRDAGYMNMPNLPLAKRIEMARTDRALADRLYARAGFTLG